MMLFAIVFILKYYYCCKFKKLFLIRDIQLMAMRKGTAKV